VDGADFTQFFVTSVDGKSAELWPLAEWIKREQQLSEYSTLDDAVQKYITITSYYGQQVKMDVQGRILLPQILRSAANLEGEVIVIGKTTYLEVHNREAFERDLEANQLTAEDRKTLAEIFRRKS
jgi:MraZ protein